MHRRSLSILLVLSLALFAGSCGDQRQVIDAKAALETNLSVTFKRRADLDRNLVISFVNGSQMMRILDVTILVDDEMVLSASADSLGYHTELTADLAIGKEIVIEIISLNFPGEKFSFTVTRGAEPLTYVKVDFIMKPGGSFTDAQSWVIRSDGEDRAFF